MSKELKNHISICAEGSYVVREVGGVLYRVNNIKVGLLKIPSVNNANLGLR